MAAITLKGNTIHTIGNLPTVGQTASDFELITTELSVVTLADYKGQRLILNIFPSIDTGVCAASVRAFNKEAAGLPDTKVICISRDLPFAMGRFCGAEGLDNVINLSDFKTGAFGKAYGVEITDGPLVGLHSRAIVVIDAEGKVVYTEQVPEITQEPNYEAALQQLA